MKPADALEVNYFLRMLALRYIFKLITEIYGN